MPLLRRDTGQNTFSAFKLSSLKDDISLHVGPPVTSYRGCAGWAALRLLGTLMALLSLNQVGLKVMSDVISNNELLIAT